MNGKIIKTDDEASVQATLKKLKELRARNRRLPLLFF